MKLGSRTGRRWPAMAPRLWRTIEHFYRVLPQMLQYSITRNCDYHCRLAAALEPKDAIISLNYDCLIDSALRLYAGRKWDPAVGYGLRIARGAPAWRDWGPGRPRPQYVC